MLRRTQLRRFATIADSVKFERVTAAGADPSSSLTAPEHSYAAFAHDTGLCPVHDFYRGAAQAVYSLASMLGPVNKTRSMSNNVQQLIRDHPVGAAWALADPEAKDQLARTAVEDVFCEEDTADAETLAKHSFKGVEYPKHFDKGVARVFDTNERQTKRKGTVEAQLATQLVRSCIAPVMRTSLYGVAHAATAPNTGLLGGTWSTLCRAYHSPAVDDEVLEALNMQSFEFVPKGLTEVELSKESGGNKENNSSTEGDGKTDAAAATAAPSSPPRPPAGSFEAEQLQRLEEMTKTHDVQIVVTALLRVPQERYVHNWTFFRKRMKVGVKKSDSPFGTVGAGKDKKDATAATAAASSTEKKADDATSATTTSATSTTTTTTDKSTNKDDSKKDDKKKNDDDDDELSEQEAEKEAVVSHYGGSEQAASLACDNTSRILAVSGAINVFKAIDWVIRTVFGSKDGAKLDPRAFPLHMMGLSEMFATQPARYVKSYTLVYNPQLQHWRVAGASTIGHYLKDFDSCEWASRGGFVPLCEDGAQPVK